VAGTREAPAAFMERRLDSEQSQGGSRTARRYCLCRFLLAAAAAVTLQQSTYVAREQLQLRVERTN
jgi:hypothetical protein